MGAKKQERADDSMNTWQRVSRDEKAQQNYREIIEEEQREKDPATFE